MDIVIITPQYFHPLRLDKTNYAIYHLVDEIQKMGHRTYVILTEISFRTITKDNIPYIQGRKRILDSKEKTKVIYCPMQTLIPYTTLISPLSLKRLRNNVRYFIKKDGLQPELVLVHFGSVQYPVIKYLNKKFGWRSVFVFHNWDLTKPKALKKIVEASSIVGVRSKSIRERIINIVGHDVQTFQVHSGCPDYLLNLYSPRTCKSRDRRITHHLLYAGKLEPGKKVDVIIQALAQLKDKYQFTFDIIGDGKLKLELVSQVENLGLKEKVTFHGNQSRDYVLSMMQKADCFIMVSSPETLGLVYLEALGCGCFVIGSKGEGIDGIIRDKENGLLVTPGSVDELVSALEYYFNMDETEFDRIMKAAHETALQYTESSVAKQYIQDALEVISK